MIKLNKVGNLILLLLSLSTFAHATMQVHMAVLDDEHNPLVQAAAGQGVILEVKVEGGKSTAQSPAIPGLEQFHVRRTSAQLNVINGVASMRYTYYIRSDKPGTFTIGPARVSDGDEQGVSNKIVLKVGDSQVVQQGVTPKKVPQANKKAFLKLSVDKQQAVIGEKIVATLRFYQYGEAVALQAIHMPEFTAFGLGEKKGPFAGKEVVDGVPYSFAEWRWDLYAQHDGNNVIPSFTADFMQQPEEDDFFAGFTAMFRAMGERKRIYSNTVKITVEPLPPHDPPISAVGTFRSLTAIVEQPLVKEGEAVLLAFELEGEGNMDSIKELPLSDIPPAFKWYSSKTVMLPNPSGSQTQKKRFEFVLQGMQPGDWEIPAQTFTYYDVNKRQYKKLKTQPIAITVVANPIAKKTDYSEPTSDAGVAEEIELKIDELAPLCTRYEANTIVHRALAWWLFLVLAIIPCAAFAAQATNRAFARYIALRAERLSDRRAFTIARKELHSIAQDKDITRLYDLLMQLFARRCSLPPSEISENQIETILCERGFSADDLVQWQEYFNQVAANRFAAVKTFYDGDIIQQTYTWLDRLEEKL